MAIRVVLAEDNALLRQGLARLIERAGDRELIVEAADRPALDALVDSEQPDVVVTDIRMPPTNTDEGIRVAGRLRAGAPTS